MDTKDLRKKMITMLWISFATGLFFFTFFTNDKTFHNFLISFLVSFLYSFVFVMGNYYTNCYLNSKYSWIDNTRTRIVLGIISTLFVNVFLVFVCNYLNLIVLQKNNPDNFFKGEMGMFNWIIINFALLVSAIMHAKGFMDEWKKSSKKEVVEQKLIAKSANAQFETLKNQLDPHFLFNSLNVLSALIDENPEQAQKFTASMSKIYRYILEQKDKELVSVEEEIEFAKTYTALLKTRFEDSVTFEFNVNESVQKAFVVPLSLQLLLENCIKHNFATSSKPLHIKISSEDGNLLIENNLQFRENIKESSGIGLSNIVQRYALLTKKNVFIEKSSDYFKVKIPILTQKTQKMNTKNASESNAYERASKRVKELKGFYGNLASYCVIIPFLIFVNLYTAPQYQWFWWPMLGWGLSLVIRAISIFGISKDWEEQQIQKILNKNS
ncbi:2TM domain-containing protein [Halpernia sp. GG3]